MISAVVLTKNEEKNIAKCLTSLKWCDPPDGETSEIILVDDYSTDNTVKIAKKFGAKVYKKHLNNDFAAQRNFGLAKTKGEWVLFIDADEIITKELKQEILSAMILQNDTVGFYVRRRDYFLGREMKHGETGNTKFLRLGRRPATQASRGKWKRKVHEYWEVNGQVGELNNPILHYHNRSLSDFVNAINNYSSLHALELKREGKKSSLNKIIIWPTGKFFVNYVLKFGFLDGIEGFIMVTMMSFHSFLAWTKLSRE